MSVPVFRAFRMPTSRSAWITRRAKEHMTESTPCGPETLAVPRAQRLQLAE